MATWRAMSSLLVLRDQVDRIAPNRSRVSDGLVGDADHQDTNSDHNPHYVPGVGSEIVTALDLTHDPARGFDSYRFAEVLRQHRDKRIKYVISNRRIFSSYITTNRAAWAWGPYTGSDPHTNHVHNSVIDAPISDIRTPWNLEGFDMADSLITYNTGWMVQLGIIGLQDPVVIPKNAEVPGSGATVPNKLAQALKALQVDITAIKAAVINGESSGDDPLVIAKLNEVEARVNLLISGVQANAAALSVEGR